MRLEKKHRNSKEHNSDHSNDDSLELLGAHYCDESVYMQKWLNKLLHFFPIVIVYIRESTTHYNIFLRYRLISSFGVNLLPKIRFRLQYINLILNEYACFIPSYKRLSSWDCRSWMETISMTPFSSSDEYSDSKSFCTWIWASTILVLH